MCWRVSSPISHVCCEKVPQQIPVGIPHLTGWETPVFDGENSPPLGSFLLANDGQSYHSIPMGSMYGIYANIGGILMVNVTIYTIHTDPMEYNSLKPSGGFLSHRATPSHHPNFRWAFSMKESTI